MPMHESISLKELLETGRIHYMDDNGEMQELRNYENSYRDAILKEGEKVKISPSDVNFSLYMVCCGTNPENTTVKKRLIPDKHLEAIMIEGDEMDLIADYLRYSIKEGGSVEVILGGEMYRIQPHQWGKWCSESATNITLSWRK